MNPTKLEMGLGGALLLFWIWALLWVHAGGQLRGPLVREEHTQFADILTDVERLDPLPPSVNP